MARNTYIILSFLFLGWIGYAQNYRWSVTLSYPITIDKNFIGENYKGFLDLGINYKFLNYEYVSIAADFHMGALSNNDNFDLAQLDGYKAIAYNIEPKISVIGTLPNIEVLHPFLGVGYSFYAFDISGVNQGLGIVEDGETLHGFSINGGFKIDLTQRVFALLEYDFTRLERRNLVPDTRYNRNINFIKLGAGFRW